MSLVRSSVRPVAWLAASLAATIAVIIPTGYLFLSYHRLSDALDLEAGLVAQMVTRYVNRNPRLWRYEEARLEATLQRAFAGREPESRQVYDHAGRLVAEWDNHPAAPLVYGSAVVYDAGQAVGRVEIARSMRDFLSGALAVGTFSMLLGFLVYFALHRFPLAALRRTLIELRDERERARVTLDAISDAVITTDPEGRVVLLNGAAARLSKVPEPEAAGLPFEKLFPLAGPNGERWVPPWAGESAFPQKQTWSLSGGGEPRTLTLTVAPLHNTADQNAGYVTALRDVTEWERMERELSRTHRLESLGVLAGGIAHDFNNLLTAILGNIELAGGGAENPQADRLAAATTACERARDLSQQLLTFSRGGAPVLETLDISQVIRRTAAFASRGCQAALHFDVAPDLWPVSADPGQMSQVLHNLVINAQQASTSGGSIRIEAGNVTVNEGTGAPGRLRRYVRISVSDQGKGIAPQHLDRIFDPYFTTKEGGSGLGLATVYSIVNRHGGRVEVASAPGSGTRFDVYLPAVGRLAPLLGEAEQSPDPAGGRLLLMDDDELVRDAATRVFEHLGYEVVAAEEGRAALEQYKEAFAGGRSFDLVVLDLTVPGGMGGEQAVAELKRWHPEAVVIASSGYSDAGVLARCEAHGFDGYLSKPYRLETVRATLTALEGQRRRGSSTEPL